MNQVRLTSLATLSTERKLTEGMNFDDVIKDFASLKARKKSFKIGVIIIYILDKII